MRSRVIAAGALVVLALGGCGRDTATVAMVPSSFTGLTAQIDTALEDRAQDDGASGTRTEWVIGASSSLVRQLADGAAADLLVTADAETMDDAVARHLVDGDVVTIATNRLVVALAPGNPGGIDSLSDLRDDSLLLGVCAAEVPCGRLAARADAGLDLLISVDTEEPNVRALALKIANGELDAGLVYATDALGLGLPTLVAPSLDGYVTEYKAASVDGGPSAIIEFLTSGPGRALLRAEGFGVP